MKTEVQFESRQGRTLSRRKEYFENGNIFREGLYSKSNGSWAWDVPIGIVKTYFENGTLQSEEHFDEAGMLDGESVFYDNTGEVTRKSYYKSGKLVQDTILKEAKSDAVKSPLKV